MKVISKLLAFAMCILLTGCFNSEDSVRWGSIELFRDTPAWELVNAIESENTRKIKKIIEEDPQLLHYQEPQWGLTPLHRAVGKRKYKSAEILLKLGANPNVRLRLGWPLIFDAINPKWGGFIRKNDTRMLELLLKYGADPNFNCEEGEMRIDTFEEPDRSPLIFSVEYLMPTDKTKMLVEYGADINYSTKRGTTAAYEALRCDQIEIAHLLIVEKGAKITDPYYPSKPYSDKRDDENGSYEDDIDYSRPLYPVDELLDWMFPLDSKEYKLKKEIIKAFEAQGVDYNERKKHLSERQLNQIKDLYPNNWREYLEKY